MLSRKWASMQENSVPASEQASIHASKRSEQKGMRESWTVVDQLAHDDCQKMFFLVPSKLVPMGPLRCTCALCLFASLKKCANHCGSELEHQIAYKANATDVERDIAPLGPVPSAV